MATKSSSSSSETPPEETPPEEAPPEETPAAPAAPPAQSKLGGTEYTSITNDTFAIGDYPQVHLTAGDKVTSEDLPGDLLDQLVEQGYLIEVREGESLDTAKARAAVERQAAADQKAKEEADQLAEQQKQAADAAAGTSSSESA